MQGGRAGFPPARSRSAGVGAALDLAGTRVAVSARVGSRRPHPRARLGATSEEGHPMCRNIRVLYNFEPTATEDEVRAAALQYVRKVSGTTKPSRANAAAFERAVDEVAEVTTRLL